MSNVWHGLAPELPVNDMAAAKKHYTEVLGFTEQWDFDGGFVAMARGDVMVFLRLTEPGFDSAVVNFYVSDVDALHDELVAAEANVLAAPEDKPWGTRELAFADEDGNIFRVHQLPTKREGADDR
ncbi:MAG TPA: VOC family protein [Armatimonadota bacterium]|jgi:uncharacterized glyoxalase superfamily protein PhnB